MDLGDVGRARLEFVGQIVVFRVIEPHFRIISPPPMNGGIASSRCLLAVQHAAGGRAAHLVSAEHEEIRIERLHVHGHVRDALRAVHEHDRAFLVRRVGNLADRIDRAEDVRALRDGDELRAVGDEFVEIVEPQRAVGIQFNSFDDGARLFAGLIPRHGVAVVFHPCRENLVAFLQIVCAPRNRRRG